MTEFLPDGQTQIPRRNRLAIRDEDSLTGCCLAIQQIIAGEHVRICNVGDVDEVLEICPGTEDEGRLAGGDTRVDCGDAGEVVGTEDWG
jgi:hypothetical protein